MFIMVTSPYGDKTPNIEKILKKYFWGWSRDILKKYSKNGLGGSGPGPQNIPKILFRGAPPWFVTVAL